MKTALSTLLTMATLAIFAQGYEPHRQTVLFELTSDEMKSVITSTADTATVSAPAWLLKEAVATNELYASMMTVLNGIVEDSKKNIPELENLDTQTIAMLYIAQMTKDADLLRKYAPSNTLEYLVGAGIRMDLVASTNATETAEE